MHIHSTPLLDELRADHVINEHCHAVARDRLARGVEPYTNLGQALIWLIENDFMSRAELEALEQTSKADAQFTTNATRARALHEIDVYRSSLHSARIEALNESFEKAFRDQLFPGPRKAWIAAATVVAAAAAVWFLMAANSMSSCDDRKVKRTLEQIISPEEAKALGRRILGSEPSAPPTTGVKLDKVKEVGYVKAERSRGCIATLVVAGMPIPIAFTIGPGKDAEDQHKMHVEIEDDRLIRARYGRADRNGYVLELGAPIGKIQIQAAITRGVEELEKSLPLANAIAMRNKRARRDPGDTAISQTVQSVEPIYDCEAKSDGVYTCRVMVKYADPVSAAIGLPPMQILEGDFDFMQQSNGWQVTKDFSTTYLKAMYPNRSSGGDVN